MFIVVSKREQEHNHTEIFRIVESSEEQKKKISGLPGELYFSHAVNLKHSFFLVGLTCLACQDVLNVYNKNAYFSYFCNSILAYFSYFGNLLHVIG